MKPAQSQTPTPPPYVRGPAPGHHPSSDPSPWLRQIRDELAAARDRKRVEEQKRREESGGAA